MKSKDGLQLDEDSQVYARQMFKESTLKMDPNIIDENEELYQARESVHEHQYYSDSSESNELDDLLSSDSCSLQIITADPLQLDDSFEIDSEGKWKKKIPVEQ